MAAQWPQDTVVKPMEETTTANICPKPSLERKAMKPHKEQAPNCPRCNSTKTKFCYYNNYSLSQPRYLCKTCRRYWTEGGSLRNIPVGGGSRKSKRPSSSSSSAAPSKKLPDLVSPLIAQQNPKNIQDYPDLNSVDMKAINDVIQVPNFETSEELHDLSSNPSSASPHHQPSAFELLNGIVATASRGFNSFTTMPFTSTTDPNPVNYSSGFYLPPLNFLPDGLRRNNYGSPLLLPFQGLRQVSNSAVDAEQSMDQDGDSTAGYWNGVMGGGSW